MLYESISFSEYLTLPGINYSKLKLVKRSLAHFRQWESVQHEATDSQSLGRIYDALITDPESVERDYFVCEVPRKNSKAYTEMLEQAGGRTLLDKEDYDVAIAMKEALYRHSLVAGLLLNAKTQISLTWDRETVQCKGRVDLYSPELGALIELKSTRDARPFSFRSDAEKYGYFGQLEFYRSGLKANSIPVDRVYIICQESEAPYGVQVYRIPEKALTSCASETDALLLRYKNAMDTEKYTCYDEVILELDRPAYVYKEEL